jgi:hypothetical protein
METKNETRTLPVKLDDVERKAKALELARVIKEKSDLEESLSRLSNNMKIEIKTRSLKISMLAEIVDSGIERREVECFERQDREKLIVEIVRCDTQEVIQTREMTPNERQLVLFPKDKIHLVGDDRKELKDLADKVANSVEKALTGTDGNNQNEHVQPDSPGDDDQTKKQPPDSSGSNNTIGPEGEDE